MRHAATVCVQLQGTTVPTLLKNDAHDPLLLLVIVEQIQAHKSITTVNGLILERTRLQVRHPYPDVRKVL